MLRCRQSGAHLDTPLKQSLHGFVQRPAAADRLPRARQTTVKQTTLLAAERLFWHSGLTATPKSASRNAIPPIPGIRKSLWHVDDCRRASGPECTRRRLGITGTSGTRDGAASSAPGHWTASPWQSRPWLWRQTAAATAATLTRPLSGTHTKAHMYTPAHHQFATEGPSSDKRWRPRRLHVLRTKPPPPPLSPAFPAVLAGALTSLATATSRSAQSVSPHEMGHTLAILSAANGDLGANLRHIEMSDLSPPRCRVDKCTQGCFQ